MVRLRMKVIAKRPKNNHKLHEIDIIFLNNVENLINSLNA